MQKLVTIYLDADAYMDKSKWLVATHADKHGLVEEHLREDLANGWRVISVAGLGGVESLSSRGWLAVVLERE